MAFGPVGKIRRQVMSSMRKSSSYSTYKPYSFGSVKIKSTSTTPKIKWK